MKNRAIIIVLMSLLLPYLSLGQSLTNAERRRMNTRLLNAIETYEVCASMYDRDSKYVFMQLCDSSATIYSDLLDYAPGKILPAAEYIDVLHARQNVSAEIKNVSVDRPFWKDGMWHAIARFSKSLTYNDVNNVLFSSTEYYRSDYDLAVDFAYDQNTDLCRIVRIDGEMKTDVKPLPEHFIVIDKNTLNDERVWCGTSHLEFNSFDQAFCHDGMLRSWHDDVRIKADTLARTNVYDMLQLSYRKVHWRAKVHAGISMGSAFKISSPVEFSSSSSSAFEFGVDLGYAIPIGTSLNLGIYTGVAMSTSKISFELGDIDYSYRTSDRSGVEYMRRYEIDKVTEHVEYSDLAVPVYLSFDHKLTRHLSLGWTLGAKFYFSSSLKTEPVHVEGRVYGDYNGSIIESQTENSFGAFARDYDSFLYPETYGESSTMSITGGLSINYNVLKQNIFVYARAYYEMGLTNVHESSENVYFDAVGRIYPLVYSGRLGTDIATRSFMDCVSFRRQIVWVEMGMMFKF